MKICVVQLDIYSRTRATVRCRGTGCGVGTIVYAVRCTARPSYRAEVEGEIPVSGRARAEGEASRPRRKRYYTLGRL